MPIEINSVPIMKAVLVSPKLSLTISINNSPNRRNPKHGIIKTGFIFCGFWFSFFLASFVRVIPVITAFVMHIRKTKVDADIAMSRYSIVSGYSSSFLLKKQKSMASPEPHPETIVSFDSSIFFMDINVCESKIF